MNELESSDRTSQKTKVEWIVDYVALIIAGTMFETKCAALTACVNDLETMTGESAAFTADGRIRRPKSHRHQHGPKLLLRR